MGRLPPVIGPSSIGQLMRQFCRRPQVPVRKEKILLEAMTLEQTGGAPKRMVNASHGLPGTRHADCESVVGCLRSSRLLAYSSGGTIHAGSVWRQLLRTGWAVAQWRSFSRAVGGKPEWNARSPGLGQALIWSGFFA